MQKGNYFVLNVPNPDVDELFRVVYGDLQNNKGWHLGSQKNKIEIEYKYKNKSAG